MPNVKESEIIVFVDDEDNELGTGLKLASHHANTPLHRAFSCYIFDGKGNFLVTRRALSKKVWPGVWTSSVCGHPGPGESYEHAIARRCMEEIGMKIKNTKNIIKKYTYKTPPFKGVIEHEFCPIFFAEMATRPQPNPEEVEEYEWMGWNDYQSELVNNADIYSYWAKDQMKHLAHSKKANDYISRLKRNDYAS